MSTKTIVWVSVIVFSIIGGYIPMLFGNSFLSSWSILGNGLGGIFGIWAGVKIGKLINAN